MKATLRVLLATLLVSTAASATKIPIPIEGATLNISFQLQFQALINEAGSPDGQSPSYDLYARRTRMIINGDAGQNWTYFVELDNPNFGKYGNFGNRAIVQDAWLGWAPTGITGGTVVYIDAGILLEPFSHHLLESTTNFTTADVHTDAFRMPGNTLPAFRDTGIQTRGWALNKKIGWRGGVYEGYAPYDAGQTYAVNGAGTVVANAPGCTASGKTGGACITPKRYPQLAGFVNFDLIGSEEGGWLYGAYKWGKDPILSIGFAGVYQAQALKNPFGSLTDQKLGSADLYLNLPMSEQSELVFEGAFYRSSNGSASANTGNGVTLDLGYRLVNVSVYAGADYFQSDSCPDGLDAAQTAICNATIDTADSRNLRVGINYFFAKNTNHINLEFGVNHGQSAYGPQTISNASAGYVPNAGPNGTAINNSLRLPAYKSLLLHWNFIF